MSTQLLWLILAGALLCLAAGVTGIAHLTRDRSNTYDSTLSRAVTIGLLLLILAAVLAVIFRVGGHVV